MKLSKIAYGKALDIIEAIKLHPFNQELMQGCLSQDIFAFYIEQDRNYLHDFARCHAIVASKISLEYVKDFLSFSQYTFIAEQEIVHQFFREAYDLKEIHFLTPATLSYTSYLLRVCAHEPVEIAVAGLLPCFWIYREIGMYIAKHSVANNPYARWIETYASKDFNNAVNKMIHIFDALAEKTTEDTRQKMCEAFYRSSCFEWHFWNDAYYRTPFDPTIVSVS